MTTSIKNKDTLKQIEELKVFMSTPDTVKMADEDYEEVMRGVLVQRIKDIRKAKRLTQKQLGEMMGIAQPEVVRLERGDNTPNLSTLFKFIRAIGGRLEIVY